MLTIKSIWRVEKGDKLGKEKWKYTICMIKIIEPIKGSCWQWWISLLVSIIISIPLGLSSKTVFAFSEGLNLINNTLIAFIAMEMTSYGIFQALLTDKVVWELYKQGKLLEDSNDYFLGAMLLFWFGLILNLIILIIFQVVPENLYVFDKIWENNVLAMLLMAIYFCFYVRVLFEIRNFAINLYKIFIAHNKISILEIIKKNKSDT